MPLTPWDWIATLSIGLVVMQGLWWALADFILDHVGSAPTDWGRQERRDRS